MASADGAFERLLIEPSEGGNVHPLKKLVAQLGGNTFLDIRTGLDDVYTGALAILRAAEITPTVVIELPKTLLDTTEVRTETRQKLIDYIAELARGCDVRVVGTRRIRRRLRTEHVDDLPITVSELAPRLGGAA